MDANCFPRTSIERVTNSAQDRLFFCCCKSIPKRLKTCLFGFSNFWIFVFENFWIFVLMLIDQIQINMAHDRLLLCSHGYDIRSGMKPSLGGEIFIVLKILGEGGGGCFNFEAPCISRNRKRRFSLAFAMVHTKDVP